MAGVRILTDSTSDIPPEVARRLGITVVPVYVQMEGRSLRDGEQLTREEFYRRLPALTQSPTTATPPLIDFVTALRNLADVADEVIAVVVSANLSGVYNMLSLALREVERPRVHLVDSRQLMMGLGWQAILAAEAAAANRGVREILGHLREIQPRIRILGLLDTLDNLQRSGRVAWVRAVAGRLLHIKPLIEFRQGQATLIGQVRTRHKGIERILELTAGLGRLERLAVLHTSSPDVEAFRARLGALFPLEQILTSQVGPAVGTHLGPAALGIAAITAA